MAAGAPAVNGRRFATLDGMRGVAALVVVAFHAAPAFNWPTIALAPQCVDIFFVLSGFVIAHTFEPRLAAGLSVRGFLLERLIRLFPLYLLGGVLGVIAYMIGRVWLGEGAPPQEAAMQAVFELFLLPSPHASGFADAFKFNSPAWSLHFELWVNLVFVLVAPLLLRMRWLVGIVIAGGVAIAGLALAFGTIDAGARLGFFPGGFARVAFGFFAGVLLCRLSRRPGAPAQRRSWLALAPLAAILFLAWLKPAPEMTVWIQLGVALAVAPALVMVGQGFEPPRAIEPLFNWMGAVSFPIYILHFPVLAMLRFIDIASVGGVKELGMAAVFAVVVAVAMVAARFYDAPVRRALKTRWTSSGPDIDNRKILSAKALYDRPPKGTYS